jgi:hypothetical protein
MSLRSSPLVMMMQPTHVWDFRDRSNLRLLDQPRHRTIHLQRPVHAPVMIIAKVFGQEPPQMAPVQDNHVVQAFAADTPDQAFDVRILPGTPRGDEDLFDPHVPHPLPKGGPVDTITVAQEIPRSLVPREGVDHLLCGPLRGEVFRNIDMDKTSSLMGQDEQDEQHFVGDRRHDKEIQGHEVLHVVLQKGLPRGRRRSPWSDAIRLHRRLGHLDAQLVQLSDDPRRALSGIRLPHRLDELADLLGNGGAARGSLLA